MTEITVDEPAPGIRIAQPRRGFRYGAESFWLAGFGLEGGPVSTALELGAGSGVVCYLLAGQGVEVTGVELREEWRPLWARSQAESGPLAGSVRLMPGDVARGIEGRYDLVLSNPPYFALRSGPQAPDPWKRAARTESTATLAQFVDGALAALNPDGRACFVVPVEREAEVVARAPAVRWLRVGRRRAVIELRPGGEPAPPRAVSDDGPEVRAWYAAVGARFARLPQGD